MHLPTICEAELAKHYSKDDFWTSIDGLVYDVTRYAPIHPGGKQIFKGAGKEASQVFHAAHPGLQIANTPVSKCVIGRLCERQED